ncbi:hypothetical protein BRM3_09020 [Brachybacterium huguangmaarense]|uniref:Uncharacterized protein n=1 Tax=Brachybacterium huguangmaarense TaxID=1652028 RepID=A0ABY6FXY5_9MICO|nr:hypothetical protein [Brachybacterium huguangmaarense]UYG15786.1 hypothetical protein BRM3_09020 [Brachybacterium huguangmaarense]
MSDFIDRARAEAERRYPSDFLTTGGSAMQRGEFVAGAAWAASQEPTDVAIEDAVEDRLYDAGLVRSSVDPEGDPVATVDAPLIEVERAVMDALHAAREVRSR